ncbi:Cytochrome oxidase assembly protein ShyY1 [Lentzea fradiae]|uniref:SURF1-like protein n=1 Tax=Lentzea fradiae TaxID=200378 RepID=A0A1G8C503_9PSEU|nr:SURF1 family cytochrome oxidase biogenesis protein [Lentzea fradiae]SDH40485.1 Cytochrome oxidase assembly protein ShyY1 [Lentzea fradiae]
MRFKFLLKPGWLALTLAVWVFAGVCVYLLSPWQFGRNDERQAQNSAITESLKSDPAAYGGQHAEWQKVELKGRYLPELEALARLRTVQGEAAFEVITPFETSTGQRVLVDRGYVRPVNGIKPPDFAAPPTGEVTVIGLARGNESNATPAFDQDGRRQIYSINNDAVGPGIQPGYFQLIEDQPGALDVLPLPRLESGPYFSYALQWIAFGVMAVGGWLYFTIREARPGGVLHESGTKKRKKSIAELLAEDGDEGADEARAEADDAGQLHGSRHVT